RRRHTRSKRDWSSDVCSSDLSPPNPTSRGLIGTTQQYPLLPVICSKSFSINAFSSASVLERRWPISRLSLVFPDYPQFLSEHPRSEERRVGKECRCWWVSYCY